MEFVTDSAEEAQEMREQWLEFDCVAEVVVSNEPGSVSLVRRELPCTENVINGPICEAPYDAAVDLFASLRGGTACPLSNRAKTNKW
jgi:hypothetical protein